MDMAVVVVEPRENVKHGEFIEFIEFIEFVGFVELNRDERPAKDSRWRHPHS